MNRLLIALFLVSCGPGEVIDCLDGCTAEAKNGNPHLQIEELRQVIASLEELLANQAEVINSQQQALLSTEESLANLNEEIARQEELITKLFQELGKNNQEDRCYEPQI